MAAWERSAITEDRESFWQAGAQQEKQLTGGVAGNLMVHHKHFPSQHSFSNLNKPSIESGTDGYVEKLHAKHHAMHVIH